VLISPTADRTIPLIFKGPSPVDGPIELRGTFFDVGRLQREDPRIASNGLDRLLPRGMEGDWPKPGEIVAIIVTDAMSVQPPAAEPTLREIALEPGGHIGKRVKIKGQFRATYMATCLGVGLIMDFVLRRPTRPSGSLVSVRGEKGSISTRRLLTPATGSVTSTSEKELVWLRTGSPSRAGPRNTECGDPPIPRWAALK
jgi:hypothetical protein